MRKSSFGYFSAERKNFSIFSQKIWEKKPEFFQLSKFDVLLKATKTSEAKNSKKDLEANRERRKRHRRTGRKRESKEELGN